MLPANQLNAILTSAIEAARLSGEILLRFYGKLEHVRDKQFQGDLVTEADLASEEALLTFFRKNFPDYGMVGEESGTFATPSSWEWVIDPLDGTTNFAHQHPMFAVSIGLLYEGNPVLGVIYNPLHNELYHAAKGLGAKMNNQSIQVSKTTTLENSLLATGFAYDRRETTDTNYPEFCLLTHSTQGVRRGGSAALDLAYVAAGRLDGYWERGVKSWDIAAGIILVQEAGGVVTRYDTTPLTDLQEGRLLATNGHVHAALSQKLMSFYTIPKK